jgi:CheY-like chemotaxis protein
MMPLLDGPGLLRAMHGEPRLTNVPVILVSAMPEAVVRARCPGYAAFLRKPFGFEALLVLLARLFGESAAERS